MKTSTKFWIITLFLTFIILLLISPHFVIFIYVIYNIVSFIMLDNIEWNGGDTSWKNNKYMYFTVIGIFYFIFLKLTELIKRFNNFLDEKID